MLPLSCVGGGDCESEVGARRLEEVLLTPHVGGEHGRPVVHVFVDLAIIVIIIIIIIIHIIGITIHLSYKREGAAELVPRTNLTHGSYPRIHRTQSILYEGC